MTDRARPGLVALHYISGQETERINSYNPGARTGPPCTESNGHQNTKATKQNPQHGDVTYNPDMDQWYDPNRSQWLTTDSLSQSINQSINHILFANMNNSVQQYC